MNTSDIKNLAILTEALRGRNTHTQVSDIFIYSRPVDNKTIKVEIDVRMHHDEDDAYEDAFGLIGTDPDSNRNFFVAWDGFDEDRAYRKFYFKPELSIEEILDTGIRLGALFGRHEYIYAYRPDVLDGGPATKFLRFLRETGINVPNIQTLKQEVR
jgi:hypothetical protein